VLKLSYDELLSFFSLNFNLRPYIKRGDAPDAPAIASWMKAEVPEATRQGALHESPSFQLNLSRFVVSETPPNSSHKNHPTHSTKSDL